MKHLKKDTGGYALLYVLVIVMVLVAISMMICTVALRNLQSQQAAVERMANKYAAQGEIEKIKAQIDNKELLIELGTNNSDDNARKAFVEKMCTDSLYSPVEETQLKVAVSNKGIKVTAILKIDSVDITSYSVTEEGIENTYYMLKGVSTSFTSYTIETTGGDAG